MLKSRLVEYNVDISYLSSIAAYKINSIEIHMNACCPPGVRPDPILYYQILLIVRIYFFPILCSTYLFISVRYSTALKDKVDERVDDFRSFYSLYLNNFGSALKLFLDYRAFNISSRASLLRILLDNVASCRIT